MHAARTAGDAGAAEVQMKRIETVAIMVPLFVLFCGADVKSQTHVAALAGLTLSTPRGEPSELKPGLVVGLTLTPAQPRLFGCTQSLSVSYAMKKAMLRDRTWLYEREVNKLAIATGYIEVDLGLLEIALGLQRHWRVRRSWDIGLRAGPSWSIPLVNRSGFYEQKWHWVPSQPAVTASRDYNRVYDRDPGEKLPLWVQSSAINATVCVTVRWGSVVELWLQYSYALMETWNVMSLDFYPRLDCFYIGVAVPLGSRGEPSRP